MVFSRNAYVTALGVFVLLGILALVFLQPAKKEDATGVNLLRDEIRTSIKKLGGEGAYASLKSSAIVNESSVQHTTAHIFGESLYAEKGKNGVSVCDSEFDFGCYHGFFTAAVKKEGLSVVLPLDVVCQTTVEPSACQHGLGHGILEYMGHKKLDEALLICTRTNQPDPVAGCTSGVFMEYNVPLMKSDFGYEVVARPLGKDPFVPCTDVAERFKTSCYHELGQWWYQVYSGQFERMGILCDSVKPEEERRTCFLGIGKTIGPAAGYEREETIEICNKMPESARDTCFSGAAWN